jgi:glycosyltransferase involved in cell wall biosynthesis
VIALPRAGMTNDSDGYTFGFLMEQTLGQVTHYANLRRAVDNESDVAASWYPLDFARQNWVESLPPLRSNWSIRASYRARSVLARDHAADRYDALFFHTQVTALLCAPLMRRVPSVVSLDATPINYDSIGTAYGHRRANPTVENFKYSLNLRSLHVASALVTWSEWARRSLIYDYGLDGARISVVPPGVNLDLWHRSVRHDTGGPVRILFVGGDFTRKGGEVLLQAFAGLHLACELHIVTKSPIEPTKGVFVYHNVTSNSELLRSLYATADIFVLPTLADALPLAIQESMAAGLPVIATNVGAIHEVVRNGETGFLVPPNDVRALHAALHALTQDDRRRKAMGQAGSKIAEERLDSSANARKILAILKNSVDAKGCSERKIRSIKDSRREPNERTSQSALVRHSATRSRKAEQDDLRILWLCPYLPLPISGAGSRVFNLIKYLAANAQIDLIVSDSEWHERHSSTDQLRSWCRRVEIVPLIGGSKKQRRLLQARSLVSRRPAQYWTVYSDEMQDQINKTLQDTMYDLVIIEHSFTGYYHIPQSIPIVLDQHNVESEILLRSSRLDRSRARRALNLLEFWKYRTDERRICRGANLILSVSERDQASMQAWGGVGDVSIVPNGVDLREFSPSTRGESLERPGNVLFTGTLHYSPNSDAMLYFATEIWPLIRQLAPYAELTVIGADPPREILQLGRLPGITIVGLVPSVLPYLERAQVVVAPLRIGGGTRIKILEALAMCRSVVSTSLGCEGLEVQDGRHLLKADDREQFASSVVKLFADPVKREELGRHGRQLVEARYDSQVIGSAFESTLRTLVK